MIKAINPKPNFPEMELEILKFWRENRILEQSIEKNKTNNPYIFYEGPPTANGKPGLHHVLARSFKDIFPRFWTMNGKCVERRAGWDTHGLPVELEVEKELKISGKKEIEKLKDTVDKSIIFFNQRCRESVWKYQEEWEKLTERMAYWLDMDNPYITYKPEYIEKLWQIVKHIWDRGLLYKGYKVVPYCPRCGTPLSSHEVAQGYKDVTEPSVYILFEKEDEPNTFFMSWTTTPWTLPGNVGLAVAKNVDYVYVEQNNRQYILAESRLKILNGEHKIIKHVLGKDLIGAKYRSLYDVIPSSATGKKHIVMGANFVTTEDGTGIVHIAVMYGVDDFDLGEKEDLVKFHTVDESGCFIEQVKQFAGQFVKHAEKDIIDDLKARQLLYKVENYTHSYPFCWRCDSPLLYYARDSWYVAMSKLRQELIQENEKINWVPDHVKHGRFGEFISEVKDWAFSRERYWGTPLPIWTCPDCQKQKCLGSFAEITENGGDLSLLGDPIDPHRPYIDKIKLNCSCGAKMIREIYLIDAWFDSGSMPFASGEVGKNRFPADYISEAVDQTRGWFYTLLAVGVLMEKGTPYRNVIMTGHINDEHGKKMSKSRGNAVDLWSVASEYGIDSLRMYLFSINQPGENKNLILKDLQSVMRKSVILLWNVYSFFVTYALVAHFKPDQNLRLSENIMDKWIISKLNKNIDEVTKGMKNYDIFNASRKQLDFLNEFSTWYLRRSRDRKDNDFFNTMYYILKTYVTILAPFMPFISEDIYQNLRTEFDPTSVHLCVWPKPGNIDQDLLKTMEEIQAIVEKVHSLRFESKIKIRQPLKSIAINSKFAENKELNEIIMEETNVEEIQFTDSADIKLDTQITEDLAKKGHAREFLRLVQNERKQLNMSPGESARLIINSKFSEEFLKFSSFIEAELKIKSFIEEIEFKDISSIEIKSSLVLPESSIEFVLEKM